MLEYCIIDTKKIKQHLSSLDAEDPDRTLGSLDLLVGNIDKNLFDVMSDGKIMMELDHKKKHASLMGKEFPQKNFDILFGSNVDDTAIYNTAIYYSIIDAIDESRYEEIFGDAIYTINSKSMSLET